MEFLAYILGIVTGIAIFQYGLDYMRKLVGISDLASTEVVPYDKSTYINKIKSGCENDSEECGIEYATKEKSVTQEEIDAYNKEYEEKYQEYFDLVDSFDTDLPPVPPANPDVVLHDYTPSLYGDDSVEYVTTGREMDIQRELQLKGRV